MKTITTVSSTILLAASLLMTSCGSKTIEGNAPAEKANPLAEQYTQVPKEEIIAATPTAQAVMSELTAKYNKDVVTMKQEVEATGAKFAMVFLTPECGNSITQTQQQGKAIIQNLVSQQGIDFTDLTAAIATQDPTVVTQMPKDGHLSKIGAQLVATELATLLAKYKDYLAPASDVLKSKPAIFGDLQVNADEILDGGKDLPYRLVTNSQGLRLNYNVTFPKKKQRILLFGDSVFFCPFLDNEDGIAQQLQAMYPDAEIINTANWGYSIDDYLSLYQEKAKFLEADLVIVQTSGNDIMDYYFSNRLKLSRNKTNIQPSEAELALYKELYNK